LAGSSHRHAAPTKIDKVGVGFSQHGTENIAFISSDIVVIAIPVSYNQQNSIRALRNHENREVTT
jgi:hypothetical protein